MQVRWIAFGGILLAAACQASDGWVEVVNGSVKSLSDHPSIRLISEAVRISVADGRVTGDFVYKNVGPEVTVQMGFPEPAGGNPENPNFIAFRTYVDGEFCPATRIVERTANGAALRAWWVKTVKFGRAQKRTVHVEFVTKPVESNDMQRWLTYELHPGSSWRGPIELIRVVADLSGLSGLTFKASQPPSDTQTENSLIWVFQNIKPRTGQNVIVTWFEGFLNIFVNGRRVCAQDAWMRNAATRIPNGNTVPISFGDPPILRNKEVEISAQAAAHYLGLTAMFNSDAKSCVFKRPDGKSLMLRTGKNVAWIGSTAVDLPFKPFVKGGRLRVPFCALARAMGATVTFPKQREVQITAGWMR